MASSSSVFRLRELLEFFLRRPVRRLEHLVLNDVRVQTADHSLVTPPPVSRLTSELPAPGLSAAAFDHRRIDLLPELLEPDPRALVMRRENRDLPALELPQVLGKPLETDRFPLPYRLQN